LFAISELLVILRMEPAEITDAHNGGGGFGHLFLLRL
jgi:hypothetical protein